MNFQKYSVIYDRYPLNMQKEIFFIFQFEKWGYYI